jgi:polar amino acid transport system substrate-binding protein
MKLSPHIQIGGARSMLAILTLSSLFWLIGFSPATSPIAGGSPPPTLEGKPLPVYVAPGGGVVSEIKKRGVIRNGMEAQYPPFEYLENGHIVGYDVDLVQRLAEKLGVKADNIDTAWAGIIPALYASKFDLIWSAMAPTDERKKAVTFSQPYSSDQPAVLVRKGDTGMKSVKDLDGKVVGAQLNSANETQAKNVEKQYGIKYKDLKLYDHFDAVFLDLLNGNIDAAFSSRIPDSELFKKKPDSFREAFNLPFFSYQAVAIRQSDTDLAKVVNDLLLEMKKSGELAKLQQRWFGYVMELP